MKITKIKNAIIISAIALALLAVIAVGVFHMIEKNAYNKNKNWWREKIESDLLTVNEYPPVGTMMNLLDEEHNVKLSKLTSYSFSYFQSCNHSGRFPQPSASSTLHTLPVFNDAFPVEHIEKIDSSHICVIYKLEMSKNEYTYAYVIFESFHNVVENTLYEYWDYTGETYFVNTPLSSKSFKSIKVGDTAEDVYKIDKGVLYDYTYPSSSTKKFLSYRLLKDGIMIITFEQDTSSKLQSSLPDREKLKCFKVSEIAFYPYDGETVPTMPTVESGNQPLAAFSRRDLVTAGR